MFIVQFDFESRVELARVFGIFRIGEGPGVRSKLIFCHRLLKDSRCEISALAGLSIESNSIPILLIP
jgi:hypothetical protein